LYYTHRYLQLKWFKRSESLSSLTLFYSRPILLVFCCTAAVHQLRTHLHQSSDPESMIDAYLIFAVMKINKKGVTQDRVLEVILRLR